jgi:predicted RNase H-like HicB family nuclease
MSVKRKKRRKRSGLSRPFARDILERARKIAAGYQIIIRPEDGEYVGRGLELPGVMNDGKTPDECVEKTRESMVTMVAFMLERGEAPPPPAAEGGRKVQVNVRMSVEEKLVIESLARQRGFGGISDYIRASALAPGK